MDFSGTCGVPPERSSLYVFHDLYIYQIWQRQINIKLYGPIDVNVWHQFDANSWCNFEVDSWRLKNFHFWPMVHGQLTSIVDTIWCQFKTFLPIGCTFNSNIVFTQISILRWNIHQAYQPATGYCYGSCCSSLVQIGNSCDYIRFSSNSIHEIMAQNYFRFLWMKIQLPSHQWITLWNASLWMFQSVHNVATAHLV